MELLYVLKLSGDNYYVGKTDNLNQRYLAHVSGSGASWTKLHPPVSIHEVRPVKDAYDETNTTKEYMKKHGIDHVRGGAYCQISIPDDVKLILLRELRAAADTCYTCGSSEHFTQACGRKPDSPVVVCGSITDASHLSQRKPMSTMIAVDMNSLKPRSRRADVDVTCYRCGRPGHISPECYASKHAKGYYLDD